MCSFPSRPLWRKDHAGAPPCNRVKHKISTLSSNGWSLFNFIQLRRLKVTNPELSTCVRSDRKVSLHPLVQRRTLQIDIPSHSHTASHTVWIKLLTTAVKIEARHDAKRCPNGTRRILHSIPQTEGTHEQSSSSRARDNPHRCIRPIRNPRRTRIRRCPLDRPGPRNFGARARGRHRGDAGHLGDSRHHHAPRRIRVLRARSRFPHQDRLDHQGHDRARRTRPLRSIRDTHRRPRRRYGGRILRGPQRGRHPHARAGAYRPHGHERQRRGHRHRHARWQQDRPRQRRPVRDLHQGHERPRRPTRLYRYAVREPPRPRLRRLGRQSAQHRARRHAHLGRSMAQ